MLHAPPELHGLPAFRFGLLELCLVLTLARPALAAPESKPELTIMVEDASEPFSRADGSGYANDLVRAAYAAAGVSVHLKVVPYARCKEYVRRARVPACFAMSGSLDQENTGVVFSREPLFVVHADVFQKRGSVRPLRSLADLGRGASLGIINGYEYSPQIYALERRGVSLQRNMDDRANLRMLAHGRLDAVILITSDFNDVEQRLDRGGARNDVRFAFRSGQMKTYIGFNLRNRQGALARDAFERGYRLISISQEKDRIRRRWMAITRRAAR